MMEEDDGRSNTAENSESVCLSELDQGFLTNCNLSALSTGGTLKAPKTIVVEYTGASSTLPASSNRPSGILSPSNSVSKMCLLSPTIIMHSAGMSSLLESKSSTPYERIILQKPVQANLLDLSSIDLTSSQPLWEVSQIKPNVDSPKLSLESSKVELTWSPCYQATLAEISSLIWSGTPPEGHRSHKVFTFQDSNLRHAVLELTDEQQRNLSRNLAI